MTILNDGFSIIKTFEDREYLFNSIIYSIAPAICGCKCAALISFTRKNKNIIKLWKTYKEEFLKNIPLKYYELINNEEVCTVIFYDEEKLKAIIFEKGNMDFLKTLGYKEYFDLTECLNMLKNRFKEGCPHEIGLFLGIPLQDVTDFINKKGKDYLYCGYWKVYNSLESALKVFDTYNSIKSLVMKKVVEGMDYYDILKFIRKQGKKIIKT